jgi:hypothetical protein
MSRILFAVMALAVLAPAAAAQQNVPQSGQSSGTGVAGQPGSKSGPAARHQQSDTSAQADPAVRNQDVSKVPGKAGGKSGEAEKPPPKLR